MIILENLSKEYGARTLLSQANFVFPQKERLALIGPNGVGKTTLLKMISGQEEVSGGRVVLPKQLVLGYLPQEPNPQPRSTTLDECVHGAERFGFLRDRMHELLAQIESGNADNKVIEEYSELEARFGSLGGYALESEGRRILLGLGFDAKDLEKSPLELSGGWRMRLELAKIFLNQPDFLLLDEPTNHLDLPSLAWVENYLMSFSGTLVFVSHDRPLLNRLATSVLEISRGKLQSFRGNFDAYLETKELQLEQIQAQRSHLQAKQKDLQSFVDRFGAKATKARQAQSRLKMLAKLRAFEQSLPIEAIQSSINLRLAKPTFCPRVLLRTEKLHVGYPDKSLGSNISLKLERGMKLAIIGANGIGKSTLLKTLLGHVRPLGGEIIWSEGVNPAYFAQEQQQSLEESETVIANLLRVNPSLGEGEARQILGSLLFSGDDVFKKAGVLSGGEKNRVGLAMILAKSANLLVLDEPTNHLDMSSVGVLSSALAAYEGTLLFVSHDRDFIDEVCTHILVLLKDGRSALFEGQLHDYKRLAKISGFPFILEVEPDKEVEQKKSNASEKSHEQKNDSRSQSPGKDQKALERQRQKLEAQMTKLQQTKQACEQELLQAAATDFQTLAALCEKKEMIERELSEVEEEWLLLSEK